MKTETSTDRPGGDLQVGFSPSVLDVRGEVTIDLPRRRVFDALMRAGRWWPNRTHAAAHVYLEARVGGRFFEDWGDGCGILYGTLRVLAPPDRFEVSGPMGLTGPVTGLWSVHLQAVDPKRTIVRGRHQAFGMIGEHTRAEYTAAWDAVYAALRDYLAD